MRKPRKLREPSVYPNKAGGYILDFDEVRDGILLKNRRRQFDSEAEAHKERKKKSRAQKRIEQKKNGTLGTSEVKIAQWLFSEMDALPWPGVTVQQVLEHFKATYNPGGLRPLSEVVDDFVKYKTTSGIKKNSYKDIPPRMKKFSKRFQGAKVEDLNKDLLIEYVDSQSVGMKPKIYTLVREFLDYSSNDGHASPAIQRKLLKEFELASNQGKRFGVSVDMAPTILHISEVKNALRIAMDYKVRDGIPGEWLGALVLGLYCGLRPQEVQAIGRIQRGEPAQKNADLKLRPYTALEKSRGRELVWDLHIQLNKGVIVCDERITTKTNERRNVTIRPNVQEWLKYVKENDLPLCPCDRRWARDQKFFKREVMGEERQRNKRWDDVYRHTFATFTHARKDVDDWEYCRQLGHDLETAKKNYWGMLFEEESPEDFFNLYPADFL